MCIIENCKTTCSYNYNGLIAEYCGLHKLEGMLNTKHEICIICGIQSSFGYIEDNLREYCSKHKLDGMVNLKSKNIKCLNTECNGINNKHNGYCSRKCELALLQIEDLTTDDLKNKEFRLFSFLKNNYTNKIIWDKMVKSITLRPDFRIDFNTFQIVIELDEHQHNAYNKIDEHLRIETIYNALNIPLYVIRLNPDNYVENGVEITTDLTVRFELLKNTIDNIINKSCVELVKTYETIYLCYDIL